MSIFGDISKDIARTDDDFSFLPDIVAFDKRIAQEFETRVTELRKYAGILENHYDLVDEEARPRIFSQISYGYRRSTEAVSWVLFLKREVAKKIKAACAIAAHENFFDYVDRQKRENDRIIKETDANKKWYVDMDPGVLKAREEEAIIDAMLEQFTGLKFEFIQGVSSLKAMYYGNKDASSLNSATMNVEFSGD